MDRNGYYVLHVFEKGSFLPRAFIANKISQYGTFDFEYNALFNGMPNSWKILLSEFNYDNLDIGELENSLQNKKTNIRLLEKKNSELRDLIGENSTTSICAKMFWKRKYNIDISNHFILAYKSTKESYVRG